jgi:hypothetical protein
MRIRSIRIRAQITAVIDGIRALLHVPGLDPIHASWFRKRLGRLALRLGSVSPVRATAAGLPDPGRFGYFLCGCVMSSSIGRRAYGLSEAHCVSRVLYPLGLSR